MANLILNEKTKKNHLMIWRQVQNRVWLFIHQVSFQELHICSVNEKHSKKRYMTCLLIQFVKILLLANCMASEWVDNNLSHRVNQGGGRTRYSGLYGKALHERDAFLNLVVY